MNDLEESSMTMREVNEPLSGRDREFPAWMTSQTGKNATGGRFFPARLMSVRRGFVFFLQKNEL